MKKIAFAATLFSAPFLTAQYQYYESATLYPFNPSYWTVTPSPCNVSIR